MNGLMRFSLSLDATSRNYRLGNGRVAAAAGQEDPVELDSSLALWSGDRSIAYRGGSRRTCNTLILIIALLS